MQRTNVNVATNGVETTNQKSKISGNGKSQTAKNGKNKDYEIAAKLKKAEAELAKAKLAAKESSKQAIISKEELQKLKNENSLKRPLSVQDAIAKVLETKAISDKLEFLQDTRKKLTGFSFSNTGMTSSIELKDASGKSFKSTNSGTVQLVIDTMKQELDKHIGKAEKELLEVI